MSTATIELRSGKILLANMLDIESALSLRHLARQYRRERQELIEARQRIDAAGVDKTDTRKAVAAWALDEADAAAEHAAKAKSEPIALCIRARLADDAGQLEEALKHLNKAAELAPSSPPCVLEQLSVLRRLGRIDEALTLAEKLGREFGDKGDLYFYKAECHEDNGDYQEALECYKKALKVDEKHARSAYAAGRLCELRGLDDEARTLYESIGPAQGTTYVNACLALALIYDDDGDYDKAMACCQRVLNVQPTNRRAKLFLSDAQASSTMYYSPEETKQSERLEAVLRIPVSDFELSVRSRNCLSNMEIQTLGDLVKKSESEMLAYKNFGETSLREIKEMLSSRGLRLGMMREDAATRAAMERARASANQELLAKSISELELGVRARKCMDSLGIRTIGELADKSEADLAQAKNFGRVSLNEIKKRLHEIGLGLRESK